LVQYGVTVGLETRLVVSASEVAFANVCVDAAAVSEVGIWLIDEICTLTNVVVAAETDTIVVTGGAVVETADEVILELDQVGLGRIILGLEDVSGTNEKDAAMATKNLIGFSQLPALMCSLYHGSGLY
jgi:hypothetical protein